MRARVCVFVCLCLYMCAYLYHCAPKVFSYECACAKKVRMRISIVDIIQSLVKGTKLLIKRQADIYPPPPRSSTHICRAIFTRHCTVSSIYFANTYHVLKFPLAPPFSGVQDRLRSVHLVRFAFFMTFFFFLNVII